ncbi:potassium-transporting ATPase subunit KdpA [Stutzerimonas xanthomarina]|jgi:K+-transporting ATPase ATPase A chain|uniref:potassium-transporting ATPase subunit KdpA n=1 Tax=Stutzerimonas xanthomarina TaxID=271420 RepID=UPI00190DD567|nr:potassium-transporting ATPase subunit KdpA [Stutzerimonas xanthomarina]MBU0812178.1 potassium-transporting ATPase subunit KdpA [Gammaproteobacteria bacterium]MBK3848949.1 potassium-transporting ATPase subunit KdpA [Stutzerimonas xanthomarina]MBU0851173.1 potassium-transporting ATPase subunit KdpA [Gammaproteobacteria bacterium]MBU1301194.1 potassium-transporting ATPase subunit KdpA [Gammaproteobacteria bacterium]MBU1772195.1 potassium-transporting ATPase subunit KdpA [Gammaproteobacteria ba|tara:strand:+ start:2521 stop:4218 length:1698 start_codon:yes stop_codon:yes gene_type:complete
MNTHDYWMIAAFFALVLIPAPWLGRYLFRAMEGERTWLTPVLGPIERLCYRSAGIDEHSEQDWKTYSLALLALTAVSLVSLFTMLMLQARLPLNPQAVPGMAWDLALNTAVSFVTNTNWQAYSGEAQLSYFSQMVGLGVQNFISPAVGLAVLVVLSRALSRRSAKAIGNFWVDLTRAVLYGLLPLCVVLALILVWQGVPQSFSGYVQAVTLQGGEQTISLGPAASQIAIKQLGTNGGGFFGVNSAHPFENPTAWSNLFEMVSIILIPTALVFMFGHYVRDLRQSRAILACMLTVFVLGLGVTLVAEHQPNPMLSGLAVEQVGSMEGKESRLGIAASALWATTTSAASNGSVNAMHDSFSALGGMVPLVNMMLGEIIFGGVGAGLYGMLLFVLITVFLAGLMIGRTPEYLGKKLEAREVRLLVATLLVMPVGVLVLTALGVSLSGPAESITNPGPHGLSQILYAYTSGTGNNGSAFAGFGAAIPYHNLMIAFAMLLGRFGFILPVLAIAGGLAAKNRAPVDANSFPTHGPMFVILLTLVILLVGGLTFLPALALGPVAEHFLLQGF